MADSDGRIKSHSVAMTAEKARAERIQRLTASLQQRLDNPVVAVDVLMGELGAGAEQAELWESLHAASMRDKTEAALADAYQKCAVGPRMKRLPRDAQAAFYMHAADYFQGVLGDAAAAEGWLGRVLAITPNHPEAYARLERRLETLRDPRRILELYASVADDPPKLASVLSTQAFNRVLQLQPKDPLSDEACKKLIILVQSNSRLLDALESHCRATKRFGLACLLIEQTLLLDDSLEAANVQRRHRLIELYMGDANTPASAISHVEVLLQRDPTDDAAFKAAERLLSKPEVASRAAAALSTARRARS
jgi:hypothetical protein